MPTLNPATFIPLPVRSEQGAHGHHPQVSASGQNPHLELIGGESVVKALVDRFYHYMDTLPQAQGIRAMHPADLTEVKRVLVLYMVEWMGGEQAYSAERGHPRLRMRHQRFPVASYERDAWLCCMRLALLDTVSNGDLRVALEQKFFEIADFLRNHPEP